MKTRPSHRAQRLPVLLSAAALCAPVASGATTVELDAGNRDWMRRTQPLRLLVTDMPSAADGRLAVVVGDTDLTDLFMVHGGALEYRPAPVPLPAGEYDVAVYLVSPQGEWRELARLPLRVLTDAGFERRAFQPSLDVQGQQRLDERIAPDGTTGTPAQNGATMNLHFGGDADRSGWRLAAGLRTLGVTRQANALRFAQQGADAPRFDLSDYTARLERVADPRAYVALGHVSYQQHRHLIPAFSSRGAMLGLPLGRAGAATFAAMNGTSIAGWNNFTGLANDDHRVHTANVGFELRPARPGALRIDADWLDGALQPQSGFNAGNIGDRQRNRAWGARVRGATPAGRVRFEAGYARSRFENPFDPSLAQGLDTVAVAPETRGARYADFDWTLLQGKVFGAQRVANLSLSLRHERIDPQYATVAAGLQADVLRNVAQLGGSFGPLQLQVAYTRLEDNLDDIRTILTTRTRRTDATVSLPFAELFPTRAAAWLPVAAYTFGRVHQFGVGVPPDSGFNASHVPDQLGDRHGFAMDWRGARWSFGYRLDASLQDNRQPGRERADFRTRVHAASATFAPHPRLDLNVELSRERTQALEPGTVTRTHNAGLGFRVGASNGLQLSATAGLTRSADTPRTNDSESTFLDASLTYQLERRNAAGRGYSGQLFLRYADRAQNARDTLFGFDVDTRSRTLVGGLTFGLR